jgi:hypothetical protein
MSDEKKRGHFHDFAPAALARSFGRARNILHGAPKTDWKDDKPPAQYVNSGDINLCFGVNGTEILFSADMKGSGHRDAELVVDEVRMQIAAVEHLINGLVTCVRQAKKNVIDTPSPFGNQYPGLDLLDKKVEAEAAEAEAAATS